MIAELERLSKEHGKPLMCARRKNGSWIIYLTHERRMCRGS